MVAPFAVLLASLSLIQYMGLRIDLMLVQYPAKLLCDTLRNCCAMQNTCDIDGLSHYRICGSVRNLRRVIT